MNNIEKRIYKCALKVIPSLQRKAEKIVSKSRYITFPFTCEGVGDSLIFDTVLKKFTKIEYIKVKEGVKPVKRVSESAAFFTLDDIEFVTFNIPDDTRLMKK